MFGKGRVAVAALDELMNCGYEIAYVVETESAPNHGTSLSDYARSKNISVLDIKKLDDLPKQDIDLGLSVYFNLIFRDRHIRLFKRLLNLHNAPLPRNRGVLPVNWALHNEETTHGVTLHEIAVGVDTGSILSQAVFPIDPEVDEVIDVYVRCLDYGESLIRSSIPHLDQLLPRPQNECESSYHSRLDTPKLGNRRFWMRNHQSLIDPGFEL